MAYYIRDDRMTQREADRVNHGRSPKYHVTNTSPGLSRVGSLFIHAAPTVMHDACANANVPGMAAVAGDASVEATTERFAARDEFADLFGPGHALCWSPIYSTKPDAPACFYCGKPVVGRG